MPTPALVACSGCHLLHRRTRLPPGVAALVAASAQALAALGREIAAAVAELFHAVALSCAPCCGRAR